VHAKDNRLPNKRWTILFTIKDVENLLFVERENTGDVSEWSEANPHGDSVLTWC